jgi:hypothetical protein
MRRLIARRILRRLSVLCTMALGLIGLAGGANALLIALPLTRSLVCRFFPLALLGTRLGLLCGLRLLLRLREELAVRLSSDSRDAHNESNTCN